MASGASFSHLFRTDMGLAKLLPPESPHEDLTICRQVLLKNLSRILAVFRHCLYSHGVIPLFLSAGEFIASCKALGMLEEGLTNKDCEMSFLESNIASSTGGSGAATDTVRQMVFPEFISALFRLAHRKYSPMGWTLAREFQELLDKHVLPASEPIHLADYGSIAWLFFALEREDVHRVIVDVGPSLRDSYYAAAAPDASLTYEKLRAAISKSRLSTLIEPNNHATLIKRAFLLATAVEPVTSNANGIVVSQDIFRDILVLMSHFISKSLHRTKTPPPTLVPLCTALSAAVKDADHDEPNGIATAVKGYLEATIDDITARVPARRKHK